MGVQLYCICHGLRLLKDAQMFVYANGLHDELGRTQTPRDQCGTPMASRGLERHEMIYMYEDVNGIISLQENFTSSRC